MIRQALDQLKHQIPLLDCLQVHHWQSTGRLSRGRGMGLCPLHQDHKPIANDLFEELPATESLKNSEFMMMIRVVSLRVVQSSELYCGGKVIMSP
jgi:hypothetical protein